MGGSSSRILHLKSKIEALLKSFKQVDVEMCEMCDEKGEAD